MSFKRINPKRALNPLKVGQMGESAADYKRIPRDVDHMARVAALGCLICQRPAQFHHVDVCTPKGAGPKVSDFIGAPLCPTHHTDDKHDCAHGWLGERDWWETKGIDIGAWIMTILLVWYPVGTNEDADAAVAAIKTQRRLA